MTRHNAHRRWKRVIPAVPSFHPRHYTQCTFLDTHSLGIRDSIQFHFLFEFVRVAIWSGYFNRDLGVVCVVDATA
jgi:hypothetical protein